MDKLQLENGKEVSLKRKEITVEEYVDFRYPELTKDGRRILLEAIKNDKFHFKYQDKVAAPNSIQGQNKITGLGIRKIRENENVYMDSEAEREILLERFDEIVVKLVNKIELLLGEEVHHKIKHIIVEALEEDVEKFIEQIHINKSVLAEGIERRKNSPRLNKASISKKDFVKLLEETEKGLRMDIFRLT